MENKACKKCLEEKAIESFPKVKGGRYYSGTCRECYNASKRSGTQKILWTDGKNKECGTCLKIKPISEFANKNNKPGFRCKSCHNSWYKEYYKKNNTKIKNSVKQYKNKIGPVAIRASKYGLTENQLQDMINMFDAKCWICKKEDWYAVDHDHNCCNSGSCGECVRGLLCSRCNTMLGYAKDNAELLKQAAKYLGERIGAVL